MAETLLTFKVFKNKEAAENLADVLKQNAIIYVLEEDALVFDASYANNELEKDYRLKVSEKDFEKANGVLQDYYKTQLDKVDKDYYLFEFSDEELQEIIAKPDMWGEFDYQLAQKLLAERGKEVKPNEAKELRDKRLNELAQPESAKMSSIILAYILCCLFFPIGILMGYMIFLILSPAGLVVGWSWAYAKKTLPNGQSVYKYNQNTQKQGRRIFTIGLILIVLTVLLKITLAFLSR